MAKYYLIKNGSVITGTFYSDRVAAVDSAKAVALPKDEIEIVKVVRVCIARVEFSEVDVA